MNFKIRVGVIALYFLFSGAANAAPSLAEAEEAFTEIMCGEAH